MDNPKQNDNTPQTYPCTDIGNMERFIDQHKDYIKSTPSGSWRLWIGKRWRAATHADIFNYARKTIDTIQREADLSLSTVEISALRRWSETSQSEAKNRNRINCLNGIIDLTSGQLLGCTSKDYVSKIINVDYDPHAKAPLLETFIRQTFSHDKDLIDWVQRQKQSIKF